MIDIFEEKEQPALYIADIKISIKKRTRSKKKIEYNNSFLNLEKYPIILVNGDFPNEKSKKSFLKSVFLKNKISGDFDKSIMQVISIKNIKFSSNLMYKFDYEEQ